MKSSYYGPGNLFLGQATVWEMSGNFILEILWEPWTWLLSDDLSINHHYHLLQIPVTPYLLHLPLPISVSSYFEYDYYNWSCDKNKVLIVSCINDQYLLYIETINDGWYVNEETSR